VDLVVDCVAPFVQRRLPGLVVLVALLEVDQLALGLFDFGAHLPSAGDTIMLNEERGANCNVPILVRKPPAVSKTSIDPRAE
jgi:hypothetical protein